MSNNLIAETREWYQQAAHCAWQADAQTDPKVKQQFLELKRLWLLLARRCGFTESLTDFSDPNFDVSDDALERAANIIGGQATPVTLVYGTSIVGNCACPV